MYKDISGFCPITNTQKTIEVQYVSVVTMDGTYTRKGKYVRCIDCHNYSCPIYENAPKEI
jgi:hypothetical protein